MTAETDVNILEGLPVSGKILSQKQIADAALDASTNAGYVLTSQVELTISKRLHRQPRSVTVDEVQRLLDVESFEQYAVVVVVVVTSDEAETCLCTITGMGWNGTTNPPQVVLKLVDVTTNETPSTVPILSGYNVDQKMREKYLVDKACVFVIVWVAFVIMMFVLFLFARLGWLMVNVFR